MAIRLKTTTEGMKARFRGEPDPTLKVVQENIYWLARRWTIEEGMAPFLDVLAGWLCKKKPEYAVSLRTMKDWMKRYPEWGQKMDMAFQEARSDLLQKGYELALTNPKYSQILGRYLVATMKELSERTIASNMQVEWDIPQLRFVPGGANGLRERGVNALEVKEEEEKEREQEGDGE